MRVLQLDVESAFIYAPLSEVVYMHPHPEMHIPPRHCIKFLRSLYGLKQSPRNWNVCPSPRLHCVYRFQTE
jgi:hypothetical protein